MLSDDERAALERRHRTVYNGKLPEFEAEWVADRVLAGRNCLTEWDVRDLVTEHGITHVLDLREEHEWLPPRHGLEAVEAAARLGVVRRHVPITDCDVPSDEDLDRAVGFIEEALRDARARVYVHCRAGIERTGTVLVAWRTKADCADCDAALEQLRARRPMLWPSSRQLDAVRRWAERARGRGSVPERDRVRGALLGLACGDALGAPVEFENTAFVRERHGTVRDMVGGGTFGWAPGEWTDDTGMALAVAEGLLDSPNDPVAAVGKRFLEWRRTAKDVGSTISEVLRAVRGDWVAASSSTPQARAGRAAGNGSLMRTLPIALFYADANAMLRESARISAMTHWDPQAEVCCAAYCLWVRALLAEPRTPAPDAVRRSALWLEAVERAEAVASRGRLALDSHGPAPLPPDFWPRLRRMPSVPPNALQPSGYAGYVVECLEAAVSAVVQSDSLEEALVLLVNLAGEADTMAAVAGGAAGALWGVDAIPQRWLEVLHERERLERVADAIIGARQSGAGTESAAAQAP